MCRHRLLSPPSPECLPFRPKMDRDDKASDPERAESVSSPLSSQPATPSGRVPIQRLPADMRTVNNRPPASNRILVAIMDIPPLETYLSGWASRYYFILRELAEVFEVHVVLLCRGNTRADVDAVQLALGRAVTVRAHELPPTALARTGRRGKVARLIQAFFDDLPAPCRLSAPPSPSMASALASMDGSVTVIFSPWLAHLARYAKRDRLILFLEERYDRVWTELATSHGSRLRRFIIRWREERRFRNVFRRALERAGLVIAISAAEQSDFDILGGSAEIAVVPHGIDVEKLAPMDIAPEYDLITYGYTSLVNNSTFLAEVIEEVGRRSERELRWALAGPQLPPALVSLPGVQALGHVTDIRDAVSRARLVVAPTRVASGVKTTVLEAWSLGRPVIGTTLAFRGLTLPSNQDAFVAETASELGTLILRALTDPELCTALGKAGRSVAVQRHDMRVIARQAACLIAARFDTRSDRNGPSA